MAQYSNTSLTRGVAILEMLGNAGEPQTLTEIATELRLARSTTFRLLAVLQDLSFVHKNPRDGTYSLGFNAYRLGQTTRAVEALIRDAAPFVRELAHDLGLTTYLGALEGPQTLICDIVVPPDGLDPPVEQGTRIDAHAIGAGKMVLATRPAEEVATFYASHPPRRYTSRTYVSLETLRRELAGISADGYAIERGEYREDIEALAVPLTSKLDRPIMAIATIGPVPPTDSVRFRRRLERMRAAVSAFYDFRVSNGETATA